MTVFLVSSRTWVSVALCVVAVGVVIVVYRPSMGEASRSAAPSPPPRPPAGTLVSKAGGTVSWSGGEDEPSGNSPLPGLPASTTRTAATPTKETVRKGSIANGTLNPTNSAPPPGRSSKPGAASSQLLSDLECSVQNIANAVHFDSKSGTWVYDTAFCRGVFPWPLTSSFLAAHLNHKKIVFLGDSVVRNTFVITMARLCNEKYMHRCITRMPTYEYDLEASPPSNRGPMGCLPEGAPLPDAKDNKSECYRNGEFHSVYLRGLTTKTIPQDRVNRRIFIRKGHIGPAMEMRYHNTTLVYLGISKPFQLNRVAYWIRYNNPSYLSADATIISIGPHLHFTEVNATRTTLVNGLEKLRSVSAKPMVVAEFVHALKTQPDYHDFVNALMKDIRKSIATLDIELVPQRFITHNNFLLSGNGKVDSVGPPPAEGRCGYYDNQHPALMCQEVLSNCLLAAAFLTMRKGNTNRTSVHLPQSTSPNLAPPPTFEAGDGNSTEPADLPL